MSVWNGSFALGRWNPERAARKVLRVFREEGGRRVCVKSWRRFLELFGRRSASGAEATIRPRDPEYWQWLQANSPSAATLRRQSEEAQNWSVAPRFSVLVPVYNTPPSYLREMIASIRSQSYPHWELCLVDGGSTSVASVAVLDELQGDRRIRVKRLDANGGISANTNIALEMASGDYIALVDHDDVITPDALYENAVRIRQRPRVDLLYSDCDKISADSRDCFDPLFKPQWSPATMLAANYVTHLCVVRTELARHIDGFRTETDGAQDWDFFLRLSEVTQAIERIPRVLYHWRSWNGSTATSMAAKPYALEAQRRTLQDHFDREHAPVRVRIRGAGLSLERLELNRPSVTLLLATDLVDDVCRRYAWLARFAMQTRLEVFVVAPPSVAGRIQRSIAASAPGLSVRVIEIGASPTELASCLNAAACSAEGEFVLCLNADLEPHASALDELLLFAAMPSTGVVGGCQIDRRGRLQHGQFVRGLKQDLFWGMTSEYYSRLGAAAWYRNATSVSWDCCLLRTELWRQAAGLPDDAHPDVGMQVLAERLRERRLAVVVNPLARFRCSALRRKPPSLLPDLDCQSTFAARHPAGDASDPYYHPALNTMDSKAMLSPLFKRVLGGRKPKRQAVPPIVKDEARTEHGEFVPAGHFYSAVPDLDDVRQRERQIWPESVPISIPGIELRTASQLALLDQLKPFYDEQSFPDEPVEGRRFYQRNDQFSYTDSLMLYSMLRHLQPRRVIEIGSGYSSAVMLDTNDLYLQDTVKFTFIEPYPDRLLRLLNAKDRVSQPIIQSKVQDVDLEVFEQLEAGDLLLIDSTHVSKVGSDVNFEIFNILPRLTTGVYIHIHDIFYPFEYGKDWIYQKRAWNELYLVRAFLQYNSAFEIVFFNHYMNLMHGPAIESRFPLLRKNFGGSLYLRKIQ